MCEVIVNSVIKISCRFEKGIPLHSYIRSAKEGLVYMGEVGESLFIREGMGENLGEDGHWNLGRFKEDLMEGEGELYEEGFVY